MIKDIPRGQLFRYLLVGGWNTLFGYSLFAVLNHFLSKKTEYAYLPASILANIIAITVAYIGYKFFVFKTKGNYLREYLRFYLVYGTAALIGLGLLCVLVPVLRHFVSDREHAPYIAQAMVTFITIAFSFFGHRNFSFKA